MSWLRSFWKWIVAVGVLILALLLGRDRKWQEVTVQNEDDDVQNDLHQADIANQQAKAHDDKAHEIKAEAEKEAGHEKTSTILDRWRRS